MLRAAIKGVFAHKLRLALTALAIISGVSFISGTFVLTDTMRASFDDLFETINATIDAQVRAERAFDDPQGLSTGNRLPESVLGEIQALPEVGVAVGEVGSYAQFVDKNGDAVATTGAPTLGVNWVDSELNIADLREGRGPTEPGEVAMDAGTATDHGFAVGDSVTVLTLSGSDEFTLVGTFGFDEVDSLLGASVAAFTTDEAQRLMGYGDEFDTISVSAADGVSPTQLVTALSTSLPSGLEAISQADLVAEQSQQVEDGFLSIFNTILLVFAGVSIFVGAFIIANTFSIIVAQRRREMGLLRAVGATGGQVTRMVMVETLILGVVAAATGAFAGIIVAAVLKGAMAAIGIDLPVTGTVFRPRSWIVAFVVGVVITVVAALLPALRASRISPIEALRSEAEPRELRRGIWIGVGGSITALGVALLVLGMLGGGGIALAGGGAVVIFIGVTVLSPLFAYRMARIIGFPARRLFGMTGKLARENAGRSPMRTAATAAALMVGIALVSFSMIFAESAKASTSKLIDDALTADFVVTPSGGFMPFSTAVARDMEALPEIEVATGVKAAAARIDGSGIQVGGVDPERILEVSNVEFIAGSFEGAGVDGIIVHTDVAEDKVWAVGDTIDVEFVATGIQPLRLVGIYDGAAAVIGSYNMTTDGLVANNPGALDFTVMANAAAGVDVAAAEAALESIEATYPNVSVENQADYRKSMEAQLNQVLQLLLVLLALAVTIALIGITNTLALSVFERTREIGLLRAIGLTRRQTRSMVRYEALIVSIFGALLGLVIGVFFGWVTIQATSDVGFSEFAIPWGMMITLLVVAAIAGVLAATSPARRAAKMNVLEAISYE